MNRACDLVASWLDANTARLGLREVGAQRRRDESRGTFSAGYETDSHVISVAVWERGHCLDIDMLSKATKSGEMLCAGPCSNEFEIQERLELLQRRLIGPPDSRHS